MLVRSWNLFHGNTTPPAREAHLEDMLRVAVADGPGVLCVQEVPAWALGRLGGWTGMRELDALAARPVLGPLPIPTDVGRALTATNHGLFRSAFSGQARTPPMRFISVPRYGKWNTKSSTSGRTARCAECSCFTACMIIAPS